MAMAAILAGMPDMLERILAEHVPDEAGDCRACRDATGVAGWPCILRELAEEARYIAAGGLPGTFSGRHTAR